MPIGQVTSSIKKLPRVGVFFLRNNLVSWFSKKHNNISLSIMEAEYSTVSNICSQLIWMKSMLQDYGVAQDVASSSMTLYCDNIIAINIFKNLVWHSRTKHIDIRHHFIQSLVQDKVIELKHVPTYHQLPDFFTKGTDASRFETLRPSLGLCVL